MEITTQSLINRATRFALTYVMFEDDINTERLQDELARRHRLIKFQKEYLIQNKQLPKP